MKTKTIRIFVGGTTPFADNRGNAAIFRGLVELVDRISLDEDMRGFKFILYFWHTYPESLTRPIIGIKTTKLKLVRRINLALYVLYDKLDFVVNYNSILYLIHLIKLINRLFLSLLLATLCKMGINIKNIPDSVIRALESSDLVIEINYGDTFSDYYGKPILFSNIIRMLIYLLLQKKVLLFPQYLGSFKSTVFRLIAKLLMNRISIVMVRDPISMLNIKRLNLWKPKLYLVPDLGFLVPISKSERLFPLRSMSKKHCDLVLCFVPNLLLLKRPKLLKEFIRALEALQESTNVYLVLIPHGSSADDKVDEKTVCDIIKRIIRRLHRSIDVISISNELRVEDLWSAIGVCDVLISFPMHPTIPAALLGTPFLVISDKEKVYGLVKLLGLSMDHIIPPNNFDQEIFLKRLSKITERYERIRFDLITRSNNLEKITFKRLSEVLKTIINEVMSNGKDR